MRIFTIDPSTHVGWAFSSPDLKRPIFGSKDFSEYSGVDGRVHSEFRKWLIHQLEAAEPEVVVVESPFFRGKNSEFLYGFFNIIAMVAYEGGWWSKRQPIQCEKIHLAHAKKHVTGRGDADKKQVITAITQLGYSVTNDHEADALAMLHFKLAHTADHQHSPGKTVSLQPRTLNRLKRQRKRVK